jgi:hypothetical protein
MATIVFTVETNAPTDSPTFQRIIREVRDSLTMETSIPPGMDEPLKKALLSVTVDGEPYTIKGPYD